MVIMLPWESDTVLRKSKHPHPSSQHTPHLTGSKERRKVPSLFHTEKITFISGGDKNVQSKVSFHSSLHWRVLSAEADGTCHCSRGFTWSSLLHQCPLTPPPPTKGGGRGGCQGESVTEQFQHNWHEGFSRRWCRTMDVSLRMYDKRH